MKRLQLFKYALSERNKDIRDFAREHDVSRQSVYICLRNPKFSKRLNEAIETEIKKVNWGEVV